MKKFITILMLLFGVIVLAQKDEVKHYLAFSIDPKMAIEGPYSGQSNDIGATFNYEVRIGVEKTITYYSGFRAGIAYENHDAIHYSKFVLQLDYMLTNHLLWFKVDGFNQYAGIEVGPIFRDLDALDLSMKPDVHYSTVWYNPGINAEIQFLV